MITRKAAPALAAGCSIVIKPANETPYSALALVKLAEMAGIPAGVINVVTGKSQEIGAVFTGHEKVKKLTFTGSTPVGRLLMQQCSSTIKKLALELGGNAPLIIFDDADLDKAVQGAILLNSVMLDKRVFVPIVFMYMTRFIRHLLKSLCKKCKNSKLAMVLKQTYRLVL